MFKRSLLALPFLLIAFGMAAGCHSTIPSLLLTIEDPTGLAPTQLRVTVSVEELETHNLTRPEVPVAPLASPQTLRLFMPDDAVGKRVDLTVDALRDGVVVGTAVTVTVLKAVEDTLLEMALVPTAEPETCDATTCPFGCCDGNVCIEGDVGACGAGGGACTACDTTSADQCVEGSCRCGADAPCPAGYQCQEGACAPSGEGQSCTVSEQCNAPPGQCYEAQGTCGEDGKCAYAPKATTEGCDDGNSCTDGDHCDGAGACVSTPKACNGPTGQCIADAGECVNGTCRYDPMPINTGCTDNNACTDNDRCDGSGSCKGTPKSCTTNDPCKVASCQGGNCVLTNKADNTSCGAADTCSHQVCQAGSCVTKARNVGGSCSGSDACTTGTTCQSNGTCGGGSPKCTTSDPCKTANCQNGNCTLVNKPDNTSCGAVDTCSHQVCQAGSCVTKARNVGNSCSGGDACRENTTCQSNGTCGGGTPKTCTTTNPCKVASCQGGTCVLTNKADNTVCGAVDTCSHQVCQAGSCVTKARNVGNSCAGSDACRENTTCQSNGTCGGGNQKVCNDPPNNQCWEPTGTCSSGSCSYTRKAAGTTCGTNNECKSSACNSSGQCVSTNINNGEYCGMACGTCSGGTCSGGCPSGMHCCGDYCEQNGRECR